MVIKIVKISNEKSKKISVFFFTNLIKKYNCCNLDVKIVNPNENPDVLLYVAEFKGTVVGSGYAQIQNSVAYKKPKQFVYLGFMYVHPEYRGKGINGKLIQKLVEWAKDKKIHEIQLDVYAENKSALVAYKKLGFKPDLLKMRL